jgi:hypothetical protein
MATNTKGKFNFQKFIEDKKKEKDGDEDKKKGKSAVGKKVKKSKGTAGTEETLSPLARARMSLASLSKAGTAGTEVPADPSGGGRGLNVRGHQVIQAPADPAYSGGTSTKIIGHPGVSEQGVSAPRMAWGTNEFDQSNPEGTEMPETSNEAVMAGTEERLRAKQARSQAAGATSTAGLSRDGFRKGDRYTPVTAEAVYERIAQLGNGELADIVEASSALEHLTDTFVGVGDNLGKGIGLMDVRTKSLYKSLKALRKAQKQQAKLLGAFAPVMEVLLQQAEEREALQKSQGALGGPTIFQQPQIRPVSPGIAILQSSGGALPSGSGRGLPAGMNKIKFVDGLQKANAAERINRDTFLALSLRADTSDLNELWNQIPPDIQDLIAQAS